MIWEIIIGLEIHAQLNTKSKLFSSAPNRFGDDPNTNITVVDTGQPGSLPVLNREAVRKAVQFGLAIHGKITKVSTFDRKSYFYPDSPRNFQITQFDRPIVKGGRISCEIDGQMKKFAINRVHLEDDAGMLKHFSSFSGIDYNRAGAPLIEIVSEPCLSSAVEASTYAKSIKAILEYIEASECNMEEGQLRFDANISVRPKGEKTLRPKAEIKNMNSFTFLEMAINAEVERQIKLYEKLPHDDPANVMVSGTYRWDATSKQTKLMRMKETSDDYRYFPEPDLLPIVLTDTYIEDLKKSLPELPNEKKKRYVDKLHLSSYAAATLVIDKKMCDYFEEALQFSSNAKALCNWITIEFAGRLKEKDQDLLSIALPSKHVAKLVNLIDQKVITGRIAKQVADDMVKSPKKDPEQIVSDNPNYQPLSDSNAIDPIVEKVLSDNPQSIQDYLSGKKKALSFLVGQVMKLTKGKASPDIVNQLIHEKLDSKS